MVSLKCSTDDKISLDAISDLVKILRVVVRHPAWEKLFALNLSVGYFESQSAIVRQQSIHFAAGLVYLVLFSPARLGRRRCFYGRGYF